MLRPLRASDAGLIRLFTSDLRMAEMLPSLPHPLPAGAAEAFVARAMAEERGEHVWAIDGTFHGLPEVMGVVSVRLIGALRGELHFWVAPQLWNTGIAQEALDGFIADNPLNISALFAEVIQDNAAAANVLSHCGFTYLGDSETFSIARNALVPTWTYSRKLE